MDHALFAVIMVAYVHGVSAGKVDDLVQALGGASGISTSEVSRLCAALDEEVGAFGDRSLVEAYGGTALPRDGWSRLTYRSGPTGTTLASR
jgi:transposase-like protein